ncbi:MAG: hypothetical protein QM493_10430 [Sulfurovum sp.]
MNEKLLISPKDFQKRYTTSLATQYIWRKEKKVPFIKIGRNILYQQEKIDTLAKEGKLGLAPMIAILKK